MEAQGDIYTRILRLEEMTGKTASEVREMRKEIREVRNELQSINAKFNSIGMFYSAGLLAFWVILAITISTILLAAAANAIRKRFQPSITLEDVKRVAKEITETTAGEIAERVANIERHLSGGK